MNQTKKKSDPLGWGGPDLWVWPMGLKDLFFWFYWFFWFLIGFQLILYGFLELLVKSIAFIPQPVLALNGSWRGIIDILGGFAEVCHLFSLLFTTLRDTSSRFVETK